MRKLLKIMLYLFAGLALLILLYFGADAVLSRIPGNTEINGSSTQNRYDVHILSNGVHTDLVFPVVSDLIDWRTIFSTEHNLVKDSTLQYVAIGWGDKGFYLNTPEWKDLTVKTALIAGLGIGQTALHVTYYRQMHEDEQCYKITIDEDQYRALIDYVRQSLELDNAGNVLLIHTDAQYGDSDAFYEANGAYSLFFSCNTWTNKALKSANMPSGIWTVFDKGILRHYKNDK